jgi:hypothetical protein
MMRVQFPNHTLTTEYLSFLSPQAKYFPKVATEGTFDLSQNVPGEETNLNN